MHAATCSSCSAPCSVPFKPNGRKPLFCNDCFRNEGEASSDRFQGRSKERSSDRPRHVPRAGNDDVARQLKELNQKVDRLLRLLATEE